MNSKLAICGGPTMVDAGTLWPPPVPQATADIVLEALYDRRPCGFAGNDSPFRTRAEEQFAFERGYAYGIGTTNGTDAITLAIVAPALRRGPGWLDGRTQVVEPMFSWIPGSAGGARRAGFELLGHEPEYVFIDARAEDWTIDEQAVVAYLLEQGDRVLAVVVPALLDTHPAMQPIIAAARDCGAIVVHDGAQLGGGRQPGPLLADADTESDQGGKSRGFRSGDLGFAFFQHEDDAWIARRFTDAGNMPGGALDPTNGRPVDGVVFPPCPNMRASGMLAALALAGDAEMKRWLPTVRRNRIQMGTVIAAPDGTPVFELPALQPGYSENGPTYGASMKLSEAARRAYGLEPYHWVEIFRGQGFSTGPDYWGEHRYGFGTRLPYAPAKNDPEWQPRVTRGQYPRTEDIVRRGLMVHCGLLAQPEFPTWLTETVALATGDGGRAARAALGI